MDVKRRVEWGLGGAAALFGAAAASYATYVEIGMAALRRMPLRRWPATPILC